MQARSSVLNNTLFFDWLIPLILIALIAPFTPELDLAFARYFYNPLDNSFSTHPFFTFIYNWGVVPGQIFGLAALFVFLFSFVSESFVKWRKLALQIGLTLAIGAGILTHFVLKDHWQRPRPKQVELFGGTEPFRPFYQPNFFAEGQFKSFPSGHSTMGFCFFSLAIYARREGRKGLLIGSLFLAMGLGICLSITRIAQGGHFFSDTFVSACLMWITAATCDWFLYRPSIQPKKT